MGGRRRQAASPVPMVLILVGVFLVGMVSVKAVGASGTASHVDMQIQGDELQLSYAKSFARDLPSVAQVYGNDWLLGQVGRDVTLTQVRREPGADASTFRVYTQSKAFVMGMSWNIKTLYLCRESLTEQQWFKSCALQTRYGDASYAFKSAESIYQCRPDAENATVHCRFTVKSRLKSIGFGPISRNEQSLALSGAIESTTVLESGSLAVENNLSDAEMIRVHFKNSNVHRILTTIIDEQKPFAMSGDWKQFKTQITFTAASDRYTMTQGPLHRTIKTESSDWRPLYDRDQSLKDLP